MNNTHFKMRYEVAVMICDIIGSCPVEEKAKCIPPNVCNYCLKKADVILACVKEDVEKMRKDLGKGFGVEYTDGYEDCLTDIRTMLTEEK